MMRDRRLWSTTPKRLSQFVGALLESGIPSASVKELQFALRENRFYPARDLPQFCVPEPPDIFFTYHSAQNFEDIKEIVRQAVDFAVRQLQGTPLAPRPEELEPMIQDGVRIWVDFMFIDQAARDLREELLALPELMKTASAHFVLGSQPLMRAWCCYEIALFNQHLATADPPLTAAGIKGDGPRLRSYVAPTRSFYIGWERTETSEPQDKNFIAERIATAFPDGFSGFNHIMAEANTLATLSFAEATTWTSPTADANLRLAAETWYARWMSAEHPASSPPPNNGLQQTPPSRSLGRRS